MKNIDTSNVIKNLKQLFGRFGYPESITLDNGPQFNNLEFKDFAKEIGTALNYTTPYSPWQNGMIERNNKTLKSFIQKSLSCGKKWKEELPNFILTRNSTFNSTTGKTPGELFFRRQMRNKIPDVSIFDQNDEDIEEKDTEMKVRGKQKGDIDNKAKDSEIETNDEVFTQRMNKNSKLDSNFGPEIHKVIEKVGKDLVLKSKETGKVSRRNAIHVKRAPQDFSLMEARPKRDIKKPTRFDL